VTLVDMREQVLGVVAEHGIDGGVVEVGSSASRISR